MGKPFSESDIFEIMTRHLGVNFIYEQAGEGLKHPVLTQKMSDHSLATAIKELPVEIIDRLKEATELSDAAMIDEVVEEIRTEHVELAEALSEFARNFVYEDILALVHMATKPIAEKQDN